jgi:cell division protein FtsA
VGLDIGTTRTCVVIAEVTGDVVRRPELKILGVGQARTGGMRREVVTHIEETTESVRQAMKEAELMAGVTVDRVYAGIGGDHVEARSSTGVVAVQREEITEADVLRVHEVARAVALPPDRELLHAIPQEYRVDHQDGIKDPVGMSGTRLETEVHLVTCSAAAAGNIRKAVSRAGYRVQELVLDPLASARAVLTEDEKEVGVVMVEIGGGTTDVAAYYEGKIQHLSILPVGGITVTQDLVKGLSIPFAEARRLKETVAVAVAGPGGSHQPPWKSPAPAPARPGTWPWNSSATSWSSVWTRCWGWSGISWRPGISWPTWAPASSSPAVPAPCRGSWSWPSSPSGPRSASASPGNSSPGWPMPWPGPASPRPPG